MFFNFFQDYSAGHCGWIKTNQIKTHSLFHFVRANRAMTEVDIYTYCEFNFNCKLDVVSRFKNEKNRAMWQAPWSFVKLVSLMVLIRLQGFDILRSTRSSCGSACQRQTYWGPEVLWEVRFGAGKGIPRKSLLPIDGAFEAWLIPGEVVLSWAFLYANLPSRVAKCCSDQSLSIDSALLPDSVGAPLLASE